MLALIGYGWSEAIFLHSNQASRVDSRITPLVVQKFRYACDPSTGRGVKLSVICRHVAGSPDFDQKNYFLETTRGNHYTIHPGRREGVNTLTRFVRGDVVAPIPLVRRPAGTISFSILLFPLCASTFLRKGESA